MSGQRGAWTGAEGTPVAVDVSRDRLARITWVAFLAGPVTWFAHFMFVYLVVEAGCSGEGKGLEVFDPPVPAAVTLAATAVAALVCLALAGWSYRRWRAAAGGVAADDATDLSGPLPNRDRGGTMNFAGFLLSIFAFVSVLFVGLPALVFQC
ncbi:MAG: hypothetical protein M3326_14625 [Actinomycetota bacterium]|nr:hypothetical protein [Actinomycetota bacterium]